MLIISAERAPAWYDHPVARLFQRCVMVPWWRIERRFVMTKEAFAKVVYDELVGTSPSPEDLDELERQRLEGDLPDDGEEIDDESTTGTWIRRWVWNPYRPLALWASRADARKMGAVLSDVWVKQITVAGEDQLVGDDAGRERGDDISVSWRMSARRMRHGWCWRGRADAVRGLRWDWHRG